MDGQFCLGHFFHSEKHFIIRVISSIRSLTLFLLKTILCLAGKKTFLGTEPRGGEKKGDKPCCKSKGLSPKRVYASQLAAVHRPKFIKLLLNLLNSCAMNKQNKNSLWSFHDKFLAPLKLEKSFFSDTHPGEGCHPFHSVQTRRKP